jgi:hypothetical protein
MKLKKLNEKTDVLEGAINTATDDEEERFTVAQIEHAVDLLKHVIFDFDMAVASRKQGVEKYRTAADTMKPVHLHANKSTLNALSGYGAITCNHGNSVTVIYVKSIKRLTQIANALPNNA